jgi:hypothetical protein
MEFVLLALAGGGFLVWLGYRLRTKRSQEHARLESLAQVRKLCEEDIALLGEDLRRLDAEAVPFDEGVQVDLEAARKAHKGAEQSVGWITDADEIGKVTESLASGRYALACVQARVEGRPVPKLRVPCFFNPQHGPSVFDVAFTAPGHGTHKVPACSSDVARVRANEKPDIREVEVAGRRVPYFDAGSSCAPYGASYFTGETAIQELFMMGTSWSGEERTGFASDPQGLHSEDPNQPWRGRPRP